MTQHDMTCAIALSRACCYGIPGAAELYRKAGSAGAVMALGSAVRDIMPDASDRLAALPATAAGLMETACREAEFAARGGIDVIDICDARYPERLRQCPDPPLVLFRKGQADLNSLRMVAVVGTRRCTPYGRDLIHRFAQRLRQVSPDTVVVSGLAYGVDICAHNEVLDNGMRTVAVLAHGLDCIYPPRHRPTAVRMVEQGALVTEYCSHTNADKVNFVRRNRIVAGMCDATVIVESAAHGGGLITTALARDYGRHVFAFPGPVGAEYSTGCNNLIRDGAARLITSADDMAAAMGWHTDSQLRKARQEGIERDLFPTLSPDEQRVAEALRQHGDMRANALSAHTGIAAGQLTALLFAMEMKGVVRTLAGSTVHLVG